MYLKIYYIITRDLPDFKFADIQLKTGLLAIYTAIYPISGHLYSVGRISGWPDTDVNKCLISVRPDTEFYVRRESEFKHRPDIRSCRISG